MLPLTPLRFGPVSPSEGSALVNPEFLTNIRNYYPLAAHWLHCVSDNIRNVDTLKRSILEDFRSGTGGDAGLGLSASKMTGIPSAPFLPFDGSAAHKKMIPCRLIRQEWRKPHCVRFYKCYHKLKVVEFPDEIPPGVNQDCSSSESES